MWTHHLPAALRRRSATAYCGPGHGCTWYLPRKGGPPAVMRIPCGSDDVAYGLVIDRRTGLLARDDKGSFIYLPAAISDEPGDRSGGPGNLRGSANPARATRRTAPAYRPN